MTKLSQPSGNTSRDVVWQPSSLISIYIAALYKIGFLLWNSKLKQSGLWLNYPINQGSVALDRGNLLKICSALSVNIELEQMRG